MTHFDINSKRWLALTVVERMANIGSEVIRCLNWKHKNNHDYADAANIRALELFDLTLTVSKGAALKEIARAHELWLDYYLGANQYSQTDGQWQKYFLQFNYAARNK